ncbi:hypothetical protein PI2015_1459 [Pseudoalteromonas issachenkonii]|uniref:Uncharacterized protein n=1 Tax=Pseudoalteromonas sp. SD03 TaxID=3231719 RepID=A0AB39AUZ8_9GAMM|nr:hypothetical protein [Pseudoalteromonas issachenkonii]ALQ54761.1 hypothetical protein PI2015_1459 [Pseudoalteromonas issachenkonii]
MPNKKIEVTEYNYSEKLETSYFNSPAENASINCTNPECNNPNVLVKFDVAQFSCSGKEKIGRNCMRLFQVQSVD